MEHTVKREGCRLVVERHGSGPAVLFIQGVGVHGPGWRPQVDNLSADFTCLTFDNRGMGRSRPEGAAVTVPRMADDAAAVLDAASLPDAHVVGHSLGGLVALQLALSARSRVRSLALLCTFASGRGVGPLTAKMAWCGLRMQLGTRRMRRRAFLELVLPTKQRATADLDSLADQLAPLFGHDLGEQPAIVAKQLAALRAWDVVPRLTELAGLQTLVVSAAEDCIAPPSLGKQLAAGIPGARYVEIADAAHGLPIHDAATVNTLLREHWRMEPRAV